jgi:Concanavalin A-like lectin/glucanases superfamily
MEQVTPKLRVPLRMASAVPLIPFLSAQLVTPGLVSAWPVGEASGSALDVFGPNTAEVKGAPLRAQPSILPNGEGKSLTLNGVNTWLRIPANASLMVGDTFSFECWVKPAAMGTFQGLLAASSKGPVFYFLNGSPASKLRLDKAGISAIVTSTSEQAAGASYYLVVTKTGATVKIYVNGVDVTGVVTNATMEATLADWALGGNQSGESILNGSLQYPALYKVALTKQTVEAHLHAASSPAVAPVSFMAVEQDSPDEIQACVYALVATPRGRRIELPDYGVEDPTFEQLPLNLDEVITQAHEYEPRAALTTAQDVAKELVEIGVHGR